MANLCRYIYTWSLSQLGSGAERLSKLREMEGGERIRQFFSGATSNKKEKKKGKEKKRGEKKKEERRKERYCELPPTILGSCIANAPLSCRE